MKKFFKIFGWLFLAVLIFFLAAVLIPRHYETPALEKRTGMRIWDLPTGSRIVYTFIPAKGVKKSTPVIYLHGGPGGNIRQAGVDLLSQFTTDGFDVYLYDQIGSGFSARLDDITQYTAERHKQDLEAIVQQIGAEKVILIGQSWGAILATLFAGDNPERIEKIIFTGPGPIFPIHRELASIVPPDSLHLREPVFSNAQANKKVNNLRTKCMSFLAMNFGIKLADDREADEFATYLSGETNRSVVCDPGKTPKAVGGAGYYVQVMTVSSLQDVHDPRPVLAKAPYPVLVMKGQCDNQKWGYTQEYLQIFPHHQLLLVPDAGHSIPAEQPEMYISSIRDFLNKPVEIE